MAARMLVSTPNLGRYADEQLRRASARLTKSVARRFGDNIGMWVGCGYPKSGTVWLCQLLSSCLDIPHPRNYRLPIAMPSIIHAHWLPDPRLPRTVYIVRDGRDVMVSRYYYEVRQSTNSLNPSAARTRRERLTRLFGPNADLNDAYENLPRFIEAEFDQPSWVTTSWSEHVSAWLDQDAVQVAIVRYEDLLESVEKALGSAIGALGVEVDSEVLRTAAARFAFAGQSARSRLVGYRGPYLRKGAPGDWQAHFSPESSSMFHEREGETLHRLGYAMPPS